MRTRWKVEKGLRSGLRLRMLQAWKCSLGQARAVCVEVALRPLRIHLHAESSAERSRRWSSAWPPAWVSPST